MNYIVLNHGGLGDHIVMSGYIHYILRKKDTINICILMANQGYARNTLEHLYSDYKQVSFYYFNDDSNEVFSMINRRPFMSECIFKNKKYNILNFGFHSGNLDVYNKLRIENNWASAFYLQHNINPNIRYTHFTLPNNMSSSKDKYDKLIDKIKSNKYILIHDDPSRGRFFHEDTVIDIIQKNGNIYLPVIYCGINRYKYPLFPGLNNALDVEDIISCVSVLDYYDIIINATECHFQDSSISNFTDQIPNSSTLLYGHFYVNHAVVNSTVNSVIKDWKILEK